MGDQHEKNNSKNISHYSCSTFNCIHIMPWWLVWNDWKRSCPGQVNSSGRHHEHGCLQGMDFDSKRKYLRQNKSAFNLHKPIQSSVGKYWNSWSCHKGESKPNNISYCIWWKLPLCIDLYLGWKWRRRQCSNLCHSFFRRKTTEHYQMDHCWHNSNHKFAIRLSADKSPLWQPVWQCDRKSGQVIHPWFVKKKGIRHNFQSIIRKVWNLWT